MKYFVITDSTDTQVGLRLAGIEGVVVREEAEVRQAVELAARDPDIGVLLITEKLAGLCADQIAPLKLTAQRPLVVEIPDRHSAGRMGKRHGKLTENTESHDKHAFADLKARLAKRGKRETADVHESRRT